MKTVYEKTIEFLNECVNDYKSDVKSIYAFESLTGDKTIAVSTLSLISRYPIIEYIHFNADGSCKGEPEINL